MISLKGRDLLTLADFTKEEIEAILNTSSSIKSDLKSGNYVRPYLAGKTIVMIFQKHSTRTRVSFDTGIYQLGGHPITLGWNELQLGRGETVADTARTLDRYTDGIVARVFKHSDLEEMAEHSRAPVINALSDAAHPCQALGDCLTIIEKKGQIENVNVVFVGDGNNNVCRSLAEAVVKLGGRMTITSPEGYMPPDSFIEGLRKIGGEGSLILTEDPLEAVKAAGVVYTDVWTSMGQEAEAEERAASFRPYQLNSSLMSHAPADSIVMHCLPAHRGQEITDEVADSSRSVIFDQAENRLHAQKGLMALLI